MTNDTSNNTYDTIIIGAGSAGMSAAIYAARFNISVLVIGKVVGGLLNESHNVENYPGFASIPGLDLMMKFKEHCDHLKVPFKDELVTDITVNDYNDPKKTRYILTTEDENSEKHSYIARTVILTMGTKHKKLGALNEESLSGRGVSYCATCDAAFYKGVPVAIVGGGDSAAQGAELVGQFASKVYIIVRKDKMRAEPINIKRLEQNPNIEFLYNTQVLEVLGDKAVTGIKLSAPYKDSDILPLEGVFVEIGHDIQSALAEKIGVKLNDHKEIIIDGESKTNIRGVYAAGDVADRKYKQAITGAAEGVVAAFSAYSLLKTIDVGEAADIGYDS
jgi:thioredoxin reductase (NADPH)